MMTTGQFNFVSKAAPRAKYYTAWVDGIGTAKYKENTIIFHNFSKIRQCAAYQRDFIRSEMTCSIFSASTDLENDSKTSFRPACPMPRADARFA